MIHKKCISAAAPFVAFAGCGPSGPELAEVEGTRAHGR